MASESGGKISAAFSSMKQPSLTKQLQKILSTYPGGQIVKELIQNAEDAGATTIELVCDEREFQESRRRGKQENYSKFFEGPALCVYNDALFTEADWEGIRMIDSSVKEDDRLTVGRFGQGFKSVFHLTDNPCVLSGNTLLLIDPQQQRDRVNAMMELKLLREYKGIDVEAFFKAFEGTYGITRNLMKRGSFPGTLFRFPLRRRPSELSKQTYDKDKLKELFEIFESEASNVLLFLRNLERISLHTRTTGNTSVTLAEVKIANMKDVKRKRDIFNTTVSSIENSYEGNPIICPINLILENTSQRMQKKETKTWIVVNYFMGGNASQEFRSLIEDSELQLSPYVGVAAPVDQSEDEFTGHVFCFLPLPREGTKLTGLPVHVNGYFALDQSRHHVKWATEGQHGHKVEEKTIRWNEKLVGEALPLAYITWFEKAVEYACQQSNNAQVVRSILQAIPDATMVHPNWSVMLEKLFSQLRKQKILYSLNDRWIIVKHAYLIEEDTFNNTNYKQTVIKAARLLNIDCVVVNKDSSRALSSNENICASQFTPNFLANRLRQTDIFSSLSDQQRLHILEYLLTDGNTGILENLPLLPLQSGKWASFMKQSFYQQSQVYMASQQQMSLCPGMEDCFIRHNLPDAVQNRLQLMCRKDEFQLGVLKSKDLESLLNYLIQKAFPDFTHRRLKSSALSLNWLKEVWQYLIQNKKISMSTRVPLFPLLEGGKWTSQDVTLICLTDKAILKEHDNNRLPEDILCCLKSLGIDIIASFPPWLAPSHVEQFIQKPCPRAVENVLAHIAGSINTQDKIHLFNSCNESSRHTFMLYMAGIKDYSSSVCNLLRALNMFYVRSSHNGRHQITSVQDNGYFTACKDFPVKYPLPCLDGYQQVEKNMLTRLGCHEVSLQELFKRTFDGIKRSAYNAKEVENVMMNFLSHYRTLQFTAQHFSDLARMAKEIPFLPSSKGLKRPSELFTPTVQALQELFQGQDGIFPIFSTMPDEDTICNLQDLGLKDERHVTATDLLQIARLLDQWSCSTRNADGTLRKSRALINYLVSRPSILHETCEGQELKAHLESIHFVEYQNNRPSSYPSWMPWFTQKRPLCKPNEAKDSCFQFIVGSVMPTVTVSCEDVQAVFGWLKAPSVGHVVEHLLNASRNYTDKGKKDAPNLFGHVYEWILNASGNYARKGQKDLLILLGHVYEWFCNCGEDFGHLTSKELVWNGEGFSKPVQAVINEHPGDVDLRPFYFFIPDTFQEYTDFFSKAGCHTQQEIPLLIDTLSQIEQCSHALSQNPVQWYEDLALKIVDKLAQRRDDITNEYLAKVLIPLRTEDDSSVRFKPIAECTYSSNPDRFIEEDGDAPVYFVHARISGEVARRLNINSLMGTMLSETEELGVEEWGQHESLTDRIKNILDGYKDGLSIPKELLQNADDAGATTIEFLYDERQNTDARRSLLHAGMKICQGPALWVYNNAIFSESDFHNIIKLNAATKQDDSTTIGKFGLGFCAVYNLTDVPSFVSGSNIVLLDPQKTHLSEALPGNRPGMKIDVRRPRNKALIKQHRDQFKPYADVFGCDIFKSNFNFNGTLFRLPLRTYEESLSSEMCSIQYSKKEMTKLLQLFFKNAGNLLLFIQNVQTIKVYHLAENASSPEEKRLLFSVTRDCTEWQNGSFSHTCYVKANTLSKVLNNMTDFNELQQVTIEISSFPNAGDKILKFVSRSKTVLLSWLVSWATGTKESVRLAKLYQNKSMALPLSAVAVPLEADTMNPVSLRHKTVSQGFYQTGHLFCFLPMPIESSLDFHLHGCFEISSDRRQLSAITEDDKGAGSTSWNNCLLADASVNAFTHLLHFLSCHTSKNYKFHELWPSGKMIKEQPFKQSFYRELITKGKFFKGVSQWASFGEMLYLDRSIRESEVGEIANDMAVKYFKDSEKTYVELPTSFQLEIEKYNPDKLDYIRENAITETVLVDILLDTLAGMFWDGNTKCRDKMLLFVLKSNNEIIIQKLGESECIPCEKVDTLRCPKDLIHPNCEISSLFLASDGRFPSKSFRNRASLEKLVGLGMMDDYLREDIILERCKSVSAISSKCSSCALIRSRALMQYFGRHEVQTKLEDEGTAINEIREKISFLPVLKRPEKWPFAWFVDKCHSLMYFHSRTYCTDCKVKDVKLTLASPKELFRQNVLDYVGTVELILDEDMVNKNLIRHFNESLVFLKVRGVNELSSIFNKVIEQLCIFTEEYNKRQNTYSIVKNKLEKIYDRLQTIFARSQNVEDKNRYKASLKMLECKRVILIEKNMLSPSQVAFNVPVECFPHINKLPYSERSRYTIYRLIGVQEVFSENYVITVLAQLKQKWVGQKCGEKDVIIKLLQNLYAIMNSNNETYEHYSEAMQSIVAPDVNCFLQPTYTLVVDDSMYTARPNMYILHDSVPVEIALAFGVKTTRKSVTRSITKGIPYGQKEDLVNRLKGLLKSYPRDESVLKELLQNADDAGATELHFIKDYRTHNADRLLINENFQGPALCVYNNSYFTEDDLDGLQDLGYGSKRHDLTKTGQYGVGFNAVYHLTDTPSFISKGPSLDNGGVLCIFDPTCSNIEDVDMSEPGVQCNINDVKQDFPSKLHGFSEKDFFPADTGTMFRFPLRQNESRLSNDIIGPEDINTMLSVFMNEMKEVLLFLKNITCIKISDITSGTLKTEYTVSCSLTDGDRKKKRKFIKDMKGWAQETMDSETSCSTMQSEVQYVEKISDSEGFNETWLIVQKLGASSYPEPVLNGIVSKTLFHLPVGGVALPLTDFKDLAISVEETEELETDKNNTNQQVEDPRPLKGRVFSVLPLPINTGLPVHVNGHFSLNHESRRDVWKEGDRLQWNQFLRKSVIVPCLLHAISFGKQYFEQDNENYIVVKTWKIMNVLMALFHNVFPVVDNVTEEFWKNLILDLYVHMKENECQIFPVIGTANDKTLVTTWVTLQTNLNRFGAVFNTINKHLPYDKSRYRVENVLKDLGMQLVQTPKEVFKAMIESGVIDTLVSDPGFVISFLHSFREEEEGTCIIGELDCDIAETSFTEASHLKEIITYIAKDNDFEKKIAGLPIILTADGKLRECCTDNPIYLSKYPDLLPCSHSKLLHIELFDSQLVKIGVLKELDIQSFLGMLPQSYPALQTRARLSWNKDIGNPVTQTWLLHLYQFLYDRSVANTSYKTPWTNLFCTNFEQFRGFAIVPVIRKEKGYNVFELVPAEEAYSVYHSLAYDRLIDTIFKVLNIPTLDDSVFCIGKNKTLEFDLKNAVKNCITTTRKPFKILQCLLHYREQLKTCRLSPNDAFELLNYFERHMFALKQIGDDDLPRKLKLLPLYNTLQGSMVSLTDWCQTVVLNGDIPVVGIEYWTFNTRIVILRHSHKVDNLYKQLDLKTFGPIDLYGDYILHYVQFFSYEELLIHIEFVRDNLLYPDWEGSLSVVQEQIVCRLKRIPFISVGGYMKRANELYDDDVPLFKHMLDEFQFPPEYFRTNKWKQFFRLLGLRTEADEYLILEFARRIEAEGICEIDSNVIEKSGLVLQRFIELCNQKSISVHILHQLKTIRFINPKEVQTRLAKLARQYEHGRHFIAFNDSIIPRYESLCWTSMNILPRAALPVCCDDILPTLGVHLLPSVERVISHCQNISGPLASDLKNKKLSNDFVCELLENIYVFLMGKLKTHENVMKTRLEFTSLVYIPTDNTIVKASSVVIELRPENQIKPYLYKAPRDFGKYIKLFIAIGAQENANCDHYISVLAQLKQTVGDEALTVQEREITKSALQTLLTLITPHDASTICLPNLYLPDTDLKLKNSRNLVVCDNDIILERICGSIVGIHFVIELLDLEIDIQKQRFLYLPEVLQPKFLSNIIQEDVVTDNLKVDHCCKLAHQIEDFMLSSEFLEGLLRIILHRDRTLNETLEQRLRGCLQDVKIRRVYELLTVCSYKGNVICGSEREKLCCIQESTNGNSITYVLYFQIDRRHNVMDLILDQDGLIHLIEIIAKLDNTQTRQLTKILRQYENSSIIKSILDEEKVAEYYLLTRSRSSVFPLPGTYVEDHFLPFLENDIIPFQMQEFRSVALELEDQMIDNENEDDGDVEPVFIYVRILEAIDDDANSGHSDVLLKYLVDTGDISGQPVVIPVFRLYRCVRPQTGTSEELAMFDQQPVRSFTYDENCRRIESMLKDAWTLPTQDRKRIVKRLLLKWHPDKNPNDQEYCKNVFQFIMSVIERLESGNAEDTTDGNGSSTYHRMGENLGRRAGTYARAYHNNFDEYNRSNFTGRYSHCSQSKRPDPNESRRWLRQAKNDYRAANLGFPAVYTVDGYNWTCYMCHQACEKALKAAGYHFDANSVDLHTHSLSSLAYNLGNRILTDKVGHLEDRLGHHTTMRYPNSISRPDIPSDVFGEKEAHFSLTTAREVIEIVDEIVE